MTQIATDLFGDQYHYIERLARQEALLNGVPVCLRECGWEVELEAMNLPPDLKAEDIIADMTRRLEEALPDLGRLITLDSRTIIGSKGEVVTVSQERVYRGDSAQDVSKLTVNPTGFHAAFHHTDDRVILTRIAALVATFPMQRIRRGREEAHIQFWMAGNGGGVAVQRRLSVASWRRLEKNYPTAIRADLGHTVTTWKPDDAGRLVLWHGVPGTGKTHAIRSLIWEGRKWGRFHYITDPESFFNSPGYMMQVLMSGNTSGLPMASDDDEEGAVREKWNVILLEDCGELIAAEARTTTGQGLSRLLNAVDGLLGQGMRIVLLITTNEPLAGLHEAVTRPGRCAQVLEFPAFPRAEANEWLAAEGVDTRVDQDQTIAQLFSAKAVLLPQRRKKTKAMGFK